MAYSHKPFHTGDVVSAEETRGNVTSDHKDDVSPVLGKSPPHLRQASESPDELREKIAVTESPHESLKSEIFFCKIMRSTVLLKKLNNRISSGFPAYCDLPYPILMKYHK
jgi:hypothetical protein